MQRGETQKARWPRLTVRHWPIAYLKQMDVETDNRSCLACLACRSADTAAVMLVEQDGIPNGQPGHEITYEHTILASCRSCGGGQIENLRHDCFVFEEVWDHNDWYVLTPGDMNALQRMLSTCPAPFSRECRCSLHKTLRSGCDRLPTTYWRGGL